MSETALESPPKPLAAVRPRAALEVLIPGPGQSNLRSHLLKGTARLVALLAVDLAAISAAWVSLRFVREGGLGRATGDFTTTVLPTGSISGPQLALAIVVSFFFAGSYRDGYRWQDPVRILTASGVGTSISFYSDLWHGGAPLVVGRALVVWLILGLLLVAARSLTGVAVRRWGVGLRYRVLEVVGDGAGEEPPDLGTSYRRVSRLRHSVLPSDVTAMERVLAGGVDTIVVHGEMPADRFHSLTDLALTHGCRLLCAPSPSQLPGVDKKRVWIEGHPMIELTTPGLRASHLVLKRALDLGAASVLVIVLSPLLAALSLWIKLGSPGPIFFRQVRPGIRGQPFGILKFRSMSLDAEAVLKGDADLYARFMSNGCKLPEGEDPRVTRVGRFLRQTSLDELPQLFNVIMGDMSLVGPRPLVGPELHNYGERAATLLSVKPGMTGQWQVSGRSSIQFPERAEIDLDYVRNWSFLGDLWILLLTPAAVIRRKGAH